MDLNLMISSIKKLPAYPQAGMIASHLGIVRGHSLDGKPVKEMEVSFDYNEGTLRIGDDVMAVVVAGDTREHVFPALIEAVDRMKSEATKKKEIY